LALKMDGKTVLITGSTDGVGRYVAAKLAAVGANILIHGRDKARAKSRCRRYPPPRVAEPTFYPADLSSLSGAQQLAEAVLADHKRLDLFISNAGIGSRTQGAEHRTSADGHELRFVVNYLSGFLLAYLSIGCS
jgi:NAD(P)-dependent dehydrogenase (short-subunit alcohol dehydrogenase family)